MVGVWLSIASSAYAHPAAAEPPLFGIASSCVQTVDKQATAVLHVSYNVAVDDTAFMVGDIMLPDAKTHQFFAFRGALLAHDLGHDVFVFQPPGRPPVQLPLWISSADVKRAAQATNTLDGTAFTENDIPEGALLDANVQLEDVYLPVGADDARVPITQAQAQKGVDWPLTDVTPGLYTFAGYIFSPPYNGWAPRAQLIEVVDGAAPGPAAQLASIEGGLFPYQGRIVRGCLVAPEGTRVSGSFSVLERPEHGWIEWLASEPIGGDVLELCFRSPRPELTGSIRLRLDLTAPDGSTRSFYSIDTITALPGSGACVPSDTTCCPAGTAVDPCAGRESAECLRDGGGTAAPLGPDSATPSVHGDAGAPARAGSEGEGHASHDTDRAQERVGGAGCMTVAPRGAQDAARDAGLMLWLAIGLMRLTRRRRHRTTASTVVWSRGSFVVRTRM